MRFVRLAISLLVWFTGGEVVSQVLMWIGDHTHHPTPAVLHEPIYVATGLAGAGIAFLRWRERHTRREETSHGSARFGDEAVVRRELGGVEGLIVGRALRGWLMRYDGPAHLVTLAPTRSGKGVGAILPNLLTLDRSVFCIDPKGENARISGRAREAFGQVFVLDPFEVSGRGGAAFNPLDGLDPKGLDLAEDAAMIAEALVDDPPGQVSEAHWNEEAKALIAGVVMHVVTTAPPDQRHLTTVRRLLTSDAAQFGRLMQNMQASLAAGELVARAANRHLSKSEREAAGVLSAAQRHTHFLDSPRMASVLGRSDFRFGDLKTGRVSVFVVLPPERLATHARWLRLLVAQALDALARTMSRAGPEVSPILFLLDEFAALGRLEPVERAFGLMAGYGVQLWAILQDLHQLKSLYGQRANTFLANAGVVQVFNVADIDTATWVSRTIGQTTEVFETVSNTTSHPPNQWFATHGTSTSWNLAARDLLTPDEVMRMPEGRMLLLRPGRRPLIADKIRYYEDREFWGKFTP